MKYKRIEVVAVERQGRTWWVTTQDSLRWTVLPEWGMVPRVGDVFTEPPARVGEQEMLPLG